jgi:hypothetical protein
MISSSVYLFPILGFALKATAQYVHSLTSIRFRLPSPFSTDKRSHNLTLTPLHFIPQLYATNFIFNEQS